MIEIERLGKCYGDLPVLKDCSLAVARGEVVVVCGPSGSGKSTLIKCVNRLEPFESGRIVVDGTDVGAPGTDLPALRARVGMVFQHFELFPHLSVLENVCLGQVSVLGRSRAQARAKADALLERVGVAAHRDKHPGNCPAASSSAWRSRAPWRWTRWSCCSTSRPPRSTRK
ncbi:ABC transporter, ATP-binding protein [Bordetella bronchiseptica MO275]|nr:ABC transporter, ATP-binding protein [Bordetella bronchiseptica MO275]